MIFFSHINIEENKIYVPIVSIECKTYLDKTLEAVDSGQIHKNKIMNLWEKYPDETKVKVFTEDGKYIGEIEEPFLQILTPGDIFVLGGRTYEFLYSYGNVVIVKHVESHKPTVPSWFSEMLPLAFDSALLICKFRRVLGEMILTHEKDKVIKWLINEYNLDEISAQNIYEYFLEQILFTNGIIPSDKVLLIEIYDEDDRRNIIFHALFGRRTNDALSRAYAYVLSNIINDVVRLTVTDNGFMLTIPKNYDVDIHRLISLVRVDNIEEILKRALRNTELFKRRFRHCAERSFMILRRYGDKEKSVHKLQLSAQSLLKVLEDFTDFPIIKETYREILEDYMDIDHAKEVLSWIHSGKLRVVVIGPNNVPSPFAHSIVIQGYSDIVLMEDRRILLKKLHEKVLNIIKCKSLSH